ncbi:Chaperone protein DnaJ [Choanephora cucurbitarum]|uniref:Chaperone protein DnaJ n=1 Tax=Choanephora cucurbitarum TaxID=101091 RepID=A0A1C7NPN7_9FUNG|nr:Chaperone protein DnaJ [Choanephora cucurbitarum]
MPFINTNQKEEKYRIVDEILSAPDYYRVLGIKKDTTSEEVRRAYIKRSRICHPDKFVPSYPRATQSFQLLSIAYETLSNPSSKLLYDVSKHKGTSSASSTFTCHGEDNPNDTLQRVLHQLFNEMLDGEFQTMRAFIHALNETNPGIHITEDAILQIELGFRKIRELFQSSQQYYKVIQFELMKLYELQLELRTLSYFSLWKRMQLSITICKVLLQLPIIINTESKQRQLLEDSDSHKDDNKQQAGGILNQRIENALQMAVGLLETTERFTKSW